jgi:hypothetical protein
MGTLNTRGLQRRAEAIDFVIEGLSKQINFTGVGKAAADAAGSLDTFHFALTRATHAVEGFTGALGLRGGAGTAPTATSATRAANAEVPPPTHSAAQGHQQPSYFSGGKPVYLAPEGSILEGTGAWSEAPWY